MLARSIIALVAFALPLQAQTYKLGEEVKPGDFFRYELTLNVTGKLKVEREGKPEALPLQAEATHQFVERIENADASGAAGKVIRHYFTAKSSSTVGIEKSTKELSAERRLTLTSRTDTGTLLICPTGPFTREELELVGEHLDTLCLPGLLPNKEVAVADSWAISDAVAQVICQFDGLFKNQLKGTLLSVTGNVATFSIVGRAEGTELGANSEVNVKAEGKFDLTAKRIVEIVWTQDDVRSQGPASPAGDLNVKVTMKRSPLTEEPKELSEEIRIKVPADKIPSSMTLLRHADAEGRYAFTYPREWVIVGRTKEHVVLRFLDKGEFASQLTIATWKKAEAGQHASAADFKAAIAKLQGWEPGEVLEDSEMPGKPGRWGYKLSVKGKQDATDVIQTFYLLSGPLGDQVAVTVLSSPGKIAAVGTGETELLKSISLPEKK
jgi:hypothetical protein